MKPPEIRYVDAYTIIPQAAPFLWKLMEEALEEPDTTISHVSMPSWEGHVEWLAQRTQRALLLIWIYPTPGPVGMVSLTKQNEIGIRIARGHRGKGLGRGAVAHVLANYEPLPGVPSVRPAGFVANINPRNAASIALFTGLGARHIQNTYAF